jgi:phage gpG-like protein
VISVDEYVRRILLNLPALAKDAFDPQRMQTALAVDISKNYGETNRAPKYPRQPEGKTLQLVTGSLFKAATVYRAKGNATAFEQRGDTYAFVWGVDLNVIPYARIHEYGGQTGRNYAATIPPRPYIGPAMRSFQDGNFPRIIDIMLRKLAEASS